MAISGVICLGLLDSTGDILTLGLGTLDTVDNPGLETWYRQGQAETIAGLSLPHGHMRQPAANASAAVEKPRRGYLDTTPRREADIEGGLS